MHTQIFYRRKEEFFYRHSPQPVRCLIPSTPLPSSPVDAAKIKVIDFELTRENKLSMRVEWAIPEVTYGVVQGFDYRITIEPPVSFNADTSDNQTIIPEGMIKVDITHASVR